MSSFGLDGSDCGCGGGSTMLLVMNLIFKSLAKEKISMATFATFLNCW